MVRGSISNPYAVMAISLIVCILGVVAIKKQTIDIFPEINLPVVAVATMYKGMGPQEVEGAITLRLEQLFLQAAYVEHIESRSLPGVSLIKVYFHPDYDVNAALTEITSLTYSGLRYLPQGIFPPIIMKFGAANLPIAVQTTSSATLDENQVRDLAYFTVRPQLGSVQGIMYPTTFGGTVRQITIFLDRERMLARGVSTSEVVNSVNEQSALLPAGNVKVGDLDYNVYTNSMIGVIEQMNLIPLKVVNGSPVFLKDVGRAVDSTMIQTNVVRINGQRAVYLPIMKQANANTIRIVDEIKALLPRLVGIPKDLTVKLIFDQSLYIRQAIQTLVQVAFLGGGLACLVAFLFFGNLRYTLIIVLALPLSILGTLVLLYFTGQTINLMTLGGLALVIGTLLNNNIVVLDNVHRHLTVMGQSASQAAVEGTSEVALPMLVITVSVLIVYLPIIFFTGIIKFVFVPLALSVGYAMILSYISSMTVAPVAMALLFKGKGRVMERGPYSARLFDRLFARFSDRYLMMLRWCLRHKWVVVATVLVVFVGSILVTPNLASEFFPKTDAGQFIVNVWAPEGTRVEKTEAIVAKIEDLIRQEIPPSELEQVVSNIGLPQGWMVLYSPVSGPHQAFILVSLMHNHRSSTNDLITRLRSKLARELPSLKFLFQSGGIVSDVVNFGSSAPIDIQVIGPNLSDLANAAEQIRNQVVRVSGTVDVLVRQGMDYPEIHMDLDRNKASYVNLTQKQIVMDLTTGLSSNVNLNPGYWIDPRSNNAYFIVTQYPEQSLVYFEDFLNIPLTGGPIDLPSTFTLGVEALRGSSLAKGQTPFLGQLHLPGDDEIGRHGQQVMLRDLAAVSRRYGPEMINHYNLQRTMDVLINVVGNDLGNVAAKVEEVLAGVPLPKDVTIKFSGEVDSLRKAIKGFAALLPLAIVLVYLVMIGLFRSLVDPLVIMFAVPLGFIWVIWMLLLTHTSINVESMIGTLMMIGIVVANSVLLVEVANRQAKTGLPLEEAVVEAGGRLIRPILMTALATVIGLTPMALGIGEGSELNMPLARAVIGGLLVSTVMTLLVVPVFHTLLRYRGVASAHGWNQTKL